jgi:hypothetical protein
LRKTEKYGEENGPEFAKGTGRKEVKDDFLEIVENESPVFNANDDTRERLHEHLRSDEKL